MVILSKSSSCASQSLLQQVSYGIVVRATDFVPAVSVVPDHVSAGKIGVDAPCRSQPGQADYGQGLQQVS